MSSSFPTQFQNPLPTAHDGIHTRVSKIEVRLGDQLDFSGGPFVPSDNFNALGDARYVLKSGDTMTGNLVIGAEAAGFATVRLTVQDSLGTTIGFINNLKSPAGIAGSGGDASLILRSTTAASYGWRISASGATDQLIFSDEGVGGVAWIPAGANPSWGVGSVGGNGVLFTVTASGQLMLTNSLGTDFARLQFGGTTSAFPALKRTATVLEAVLADDSARAQVYAATLRTTQTTVAGLPAAATAGAGARAFVTDASTTKTLGDGTTVAGGGANKVPVYSDGTNWIIG